MTKILFICHGNICRSPMAEFVMRDMVEKAGLSDQFLIESAATSTEELGSPVYPPVRRLLAQHGIDCTGKTARQLVRADLDRFDLLIGMDEANLRNMRRMLLPPGGAGNAAVPQGAGKIFCSTSRRGMPGAGIPDAGASGTEDPFPNGAQKLRLLLDFTDHPRSVADPWYTRDFEATWHDVNDGCRGLLRALMAPPPKTELTDAQIREIVTSILSFRGAELDWWLNYLRINTGLENLTDYIFYPDFFGLDRQATLDEIAEKIIADKT